MQSLQHEASEQNQRTFGESQTVCEEMHAERWHVSHELDVGNQVGEEMHVWQPQTFAGIHEEGTLFDGFHRARGSIWPSLMRESSEKLNVFSMGKPLDLFLGLGQPILSVDSQSGMIWMVRYGGSKDLHGSRLFQRWEVSHELQQRALPNSAASHSIPGK